MIVCRGLYSRRLGQQSFDFKTGSLMFLQTNESHTDRYAAGSKCLHVVIPSNVEKVLTSAFGKQGIMRGISPDLSASSSIALQREFRHTDNDSPMVVESLLLDLMSRHFDILRERSVARRKWLSALLDYLDDTFEQEWTLTKWLQKWVSTQCICAALSLSISIARLENTSVDSVCCVAGSCLR